MLYNLLSKDDLPVLVEKVRQGHGPRILRSVVSATKTKRVDRLWPIVETRPYPWGELEAIQTRWNRQISSDPSESIHEYVMRRYLTGRSDWSVLSLKCRSGAEEVRWAETGRFACIDAFDVSGKRIARAQARALRAGVDEIVRFQAGQVHDFDIPASSYDAVIALNALHTVKPLGRTIRRLTRALKPGGLLVVRDYVGPDRFQWSRRQLEAAEEMLTSLPVRYRVRWGTGEVKSRIHRPGRLLMALSDPAVAANSSKLLLVLDRALEQVERKDIGGTVLRLVLKDIAHNFARKESVAAEWLEQMIRREDEMMASGELRSDFVFGVWRKRGSV